MHAPIRHKRVTGNSVPWITPEIKCIMRNRGYYKKYAKRVPKNFEQFQTCDFPQKLEKLEQICGQAAVLKKTRRLQRRSLRLPTRSKSAQTGHLCTTAQAGADPGIFVCWSKFPGLKVGRRS